MKRAMRKKIFFVFCINVWGVILISAAENNKNQINRPAQVKEDFGDPWPEHSSFEVDYLKQCAANCSTKRNKLSHSEKHMVIIDSDSQEYKSPSQPMVISVQVNHEEEILKSLRQQEKYLKGIENKVQVACILLAQGLQVQLCPDTQPNASLIASVD